MKRKDFTGMDPEAHRTAKMLAASQGLSIRKYLADLVMDDAKRQRGKNAISR